LGGPCTRNLPGRACRLLSAGSPRSLLSGAETPFVCGCGHFYTPIRKGECSILDGSASTGPLHKAELMRNWDQARAGAPLTTIDPLP
jgi:hypothetical protein